METDFLYQNVVSSKSKHPTKCQFLAVYDISLIYLCWGIIINTLWPEFIEEFSHGIICCPGLSLMWKDLLFCQGCQSLLSKTPEMPQQKPEKLTFAHTFVHEADDQKT